MTWPLAALQTAHSDTSDVEAARLEGQAQVASLQAELAQLKDNLAGQQSAAQKVMLELDELQAAKAAAEEERDQALAAPAAATGAADDQAEREATWEARLADAQREISEAKATGAQAAANISAERDSLRDRLTMVEGELQAYRLHAADAAQQAEAAKRAEKELQALQAKNDELQNLMSEAFAMVQEVREEWKARETATT